MLAAGMDVCLILGDDFVGLIPKCSCINNSFQRPKFDSGAEKLSQLGQAHDLAPIIDDEKKISMLARKTKLKKSNDAKILQVLLKVLGAEEAEEKFVELSELSSALDLDFDVYVLAKLLGFASEELQEEIEIIRDNVTDAFEACKPLLKKLM